MTELMRRRRALMAQSAEEDLHLNDILTLDGIKNTRSGHNASSTRWEDLSGNQHDFTVVGNASLSWGLSCLVCDASSKRLSYTGDLQGSSNVMTIEMVVQSDGNGSYTDGSSKIGIIIGNVDQYAAQAGGMKFYNYRDSSSNGISSYYGTTGIGYLGGLGDIRYAAYVFDGTKCTRYRDGVQYSSGTNPVAVTYQSGTKRTGWSIGGANSGIAYLNGKIFRIGISAKAMTATEIAERYQYFRQRFNMP